MIVQTKDIVVVATVAVSVLFSVIKRNLSYCADALGFPSPLPVSLPFRINVTSKVAP